MVAGCVRADHLPCRIRGDKDESLEQLIARAESAPPEIARPSISKSPARRPRQPTKLTRRATREAGKAALQDVVTYSEKATDLPAPREKN